MTTKAHVTLGASWIEVLYKAKKESAAAAIMSDMKGSVISSHLRLPTVSIFLIAGRAKTKLRKPKTRFSSPSSYTSGRYNPPKPMLKYIAVFLLFENMLKKVPELISNAFKPKEFQKWRVYQSKRPEC